MDGQRFDAFARACAAGTPRRRALLLLAGAGAMLAVTRAPVAEAKECSEFEGHCDSHTPCCRDLVCIYASCLDCLKAGHHGCQSNDQCCSKKCKDAVCIKNDKVKCEGNGCKKKKKKKKH
ncbi:MAG: hypothetical protein QM692_10450 [Thermomicrobiales bacterium]